MSTHFILEAIDDFMIHTVNRAISCFIGKELNRLDAKRLPIKKELVNQDSRSQQAEVAYCQGRNKREQELIAIQSERSQYQETEKQVGFQWQPVESEDILEIVENTLRSKQQELNLGRTYLKQIEQLAPEQREKVEHVLKLRQRELQLIREEVIERRKLNYLYLDLMREKEAEAIEIKLHEIQANWDRENWSGILSREEMHKILVEEQQKHRLLMLVSPPHISQSCPDSFIYNLEMDMRSELKEFLEQHYPLHSDTCPVEFYGKYFKGSVFDTEVKQLESLLAPVPTAVIYSDITDQKAYFHVYFWGLQTPLLLTLPWDWEAEKEKLIEQGLTETQSLRTIRQSIVKIYQLIAAFLADLYYLNVNPFHEPCLLQLQSELSVDWIQHHFGILKKIQQQKQKNYEKELRLLKQSQSWQYVNNFIGFFDTPYTIAISPDGQALIGSSESIKTSKLWELKTGKLRWASQERFDAFSPDGQWLVRKEDNEIKIGDPQTGRCFYSTFEHLERIDFFTFSPDSLLLISGSFIEQIFKVWHLQRRTLLYTFDDQPYIIENSVIFSPDGQLMVSYNLDKTIRVRDLHTGELLHILFGHTDHIGFITFSADGRLLASLSADNVVKIWNPYTGALLRTLEDQGNFTFSTDRQVLLSCDKTDCKIWDPWIGELFQTVPMVEGEVFALGQGGSWLMTEDNHQLKLWTLSTGQLIARFAGEFLTFSPNRRMMLMKQRDDITQSWHLKLCHLEAEPTCQSLTEQTSTIEQVTFSQDNQTVVSRGGDLAIKIWQYGQAHKVAQHARIGYSNET